MYTNTCTKESPTQAATSGRRYKSELSVRRISLQTTVDGWNPAPVNMVNIPLITCFCTSQVVQDFFHQQYESLKHLNFVCHMFRPSPRIRNDRFLFGRSPPKSVRKERNELCLAVWHPKSYKTKPGFILGISDFLSKN